VPVSCAFRAASRAASGAAAVRPLALALAASAALGLPATAQTPAIPAFPGAEGFGATTPGGRGGAVIEVTNLNDSGPGSLREAMEVRTGPRIVVIKVGGTIELTRNIWVREANSYLTVAGQKAPGDGIQLKNYGIELRDGAHDVVIRYLRARPGDTTPGVWDKDAVLVYGNADRPTHDVVIDHVSAEWAVDENVNIWGWVENVTVQWSLIAEGSLTGHPKGPHSMGLLSGSHPRITLSVHHCLLAHNGGRNPLLQDNSEGVNDFRDNVVYNWQNNNAGDTKLGARTNYAGNLYLKGPSSSLIEDSIFYVPDRTNSENVRLWVDGNRGPRCPSGCDDEWEIGVWTWENGTHYDADPALYRVFQPFPAPAVTAIPPDQLLDRVLAEAGASLPRRDPVDARIVADVRNRTGAVGIGSGYPTLRSGGWPTDLDHDGMPDLWEQRYGLNPLDANDARGDLNGDGYTNVEEFLNDRDPAAPVPSAAAGAVPDGQAVPGAPLTLARAPTGRLALSWGASCRAGDTDYAIYEGALGDFAGPHANLCSTGGATTRTITPAPGDAWFVVVPRGALREGSYGRDGTGAERPPAPQPCLPQEIAACP